MEISKRFSLFVCSSLENTAFRRPVEVVGNDETIDSVGVRNTSDVVEGV